MIANRNYYHDNSDVAEGYASSESKITNYFNDAGRLMLTRDIHAEKSLAPINVTDVGSVMLIRDTYSLKA